MAKTATDGIAEFRAEIRTAIGIVQNALITEDTREAAVLKASLLRFLRELLGIATGPVPGEEGFEEG